MTHTEIGWMAVAIIMLLVAVVEGYLGRKWEANAKEWRALYEQSNANADRAIALLKEFHNIVKGSSNAQADTDGSTGSGDPDQDGAHSA